MILSACHYGPAIGGEGCSLSINVDMEKAEVSYTLSIQISGLYKQIIFYDFKIALKNYNDVSNYLEVKYNAKN